MSGPVTVWMITGLLAVTDRTLGPPGDLATIELTLKLRTGGEATGALLDYNRHALVILSVKTPYVFAWGELDAASGLAAKKTLRERELGGRDRFTAEDFFEFGRFALDGGRNDLAANEFERSRKLDRSLEPRIKAAFAQFRKRNEDWVRQQRDVAEADQERPVQTQTPVPRPAFDALPQRPGEVREGVREAYLRFGEKVREVLGRDIVLIESDHFLIWSDWGPKERARLTEWAELTYTDLCKQFGLDPGRDLFLAKCPVFCFRSKARFATFARDFDGYDASGAIGYTRSIEKNGHVHMAFARMGSTPADYDRFACTLVHEGTHAVLHRVFGNHLLPHWVNEGYAELTVDRVLGDHCPAGGNAALLARQFARFNWPAEAFLSRVTSIEVHEYPLAHSVIAYLDHRSPAGLVQFIRELKQGAELSAALSDCFDGLTTAELESQWKNWVRGDPAADPTPD